MSFIQQYYNSSNLSPYDMQSVLLRSVTQRKVSLLDSNWHKKFPPFHILKNGDITSNLISPETLADAYTNDRRVLHSNHYHGYADVYTRATETTDNDIQCYYANQYNIITNLGNHDISIYILRKLMGIYTPIVQEYGIDCRIINGIHEKFSKNGYNITLKNGIGGIIHSHTHSAQVGIFGVYDSTAFLNVPMYKTIKQVHIGMKDAYIKSIYSNITRNACINNPVDYYHSDAFNYLVDHNQEPKWTKRLVPDITEYNRKRRSMQKWITKLYQVLYDDMYNYLRYFTPEIVCDGIYVNREIGYIDGSEFNNF